jgi:hypothetical protein
MLQKIKGYHLMVVLSVSWASTRRWIGTLRKVQEPRRASGARSTEAGRQHCLGLDGAEATRC